MTRHRTIVARAAPAALVVLLAVSASRAAPLGGPTDDVGSASLAPPQHRSSTRLAWEAVTRRPHDDGAWTQGLVLDPTGRLFESTGLLGRSTLREVDAATGEVLRSVALPDVQFGEGLALVDDRLVQLTWKNGQATAWDAGTFEPLGSFGYEGQGWGLCYDGERLVMSDGSDALTFRDPETFEILGHIPVTIDGEPQGGLNELECVDGAVWANVYWTDRIVRIDPQDGRVTGVLDLTGIIEPHPRDARRGAVLNGIAYDPAADTFLVTGKLWPELIEIRVVDACRATAAG